jgi:hypothetical protein
MINSVVFKVTLEVMKSIPDGDIDDLCDFTLHGTTQNNGML